jgi:uncharacterized repeat protein (TIGR01451 family)
VTLSSVTVTDPLPGLSAISCPATTLASAASMTCTATYTLTQGDIDAGSVTNTATASGTPPSGPVVTDQDSATVNTSQAARIDLSKTAAGPDPLTVGSTVSYTFLVTNIGRLNLAGVTVTDPLPGLSAISCPGTTLAPSASMTCTASYTVTQADVNAGRIDNTATARGTPPNGLSAVSAQDSTTTPPSQLSRIDLRKTASGPSANRVVAYSFQVTNTGAGTLSSVTVTDPLPGLSAVACPGTTLAPGASMTCTATYTLTQADINAGSVTNTATATGAPPEGPSVTDQDSATVSTSVPVPTLPQGVLILLLMLLSTIALVRLRRAGPGA